MRIVKLLLICAGTIPLQNEARSSAGLGAMDAGTSVQEPADRPLQAPRNVQLDGEIRTAPELSRLGRFAEAEPQFAWIAAVSSTRKLMRVRAGRVSCGALPLPPWPA